MSRLDWLVLGATLGFIVAYGLWKGRRQRNLDSYILADRKLHWPTIALSIMATQASAITFLSTPGQAYADGMRFVQFYLGLPVAMVLLSMFAVPIFHRLKVYTAYEYLESRFDAKTRTLTAILFLIQRGLSTGLTIYAPALIVSVLLGWNLYATNLIIGTLVIIYTATGGTKAVSWTHVQQMLIILGGMATALIIAIRSIPGDISFLEAVRVAGRMGRLNAIDFSFDLTTNYTFWSGLIGGLMVALSYFGCDQSQVQRYLTGETPAESRLGLLFNGMVKVPMQFFILFVGAMVFVFYQFVAPPLFFNTAERAKIGVSRFAANYAELEDAHRANFVQKREYVRQLVTAMRANDSAGAYVAQEKVRAIQVRDAATRKAAIDLIRRNDAAADVSDTNYIFLSFVLRFLPAGVVGLVMAAIFCASMSSTASGLNALSSTSVVDIYKRYVNPDATELDYVRWSKWLTVFWGAFAIAFAMYAARLGSLIEAVNKLGSYFYGTILAIFILAFFTKTVGGTATCLGAIVGEATVLYFSLFTNLAWLWWNVIGCVVGVIAALLIERMLPDREPDGDEVAEAA
ncbi:MAG TPA: sodium:solute symporter [Thermoanaerobaculia bacterium]|nr:sodium:solute symporter [Thermoanaerobaculia bacterium]